VIVLADRGLYAKWLFEHIVSLHWHPFLRINQQGQFRLRHSTTFQPLKTVVERSGKARQLEIVCFKTPKRLFRMLCKSLRCECDLERKSLTGSRF